MAVKYTAEAFVFGREDHMDTDRKFFAFTKEFGRLEVFGKAIRKIDSKLGSGIDIFSFCQIEFVQGKSKKTLTDALMFKKYNTFALNPEKFHVALSIASVLETFIRGQEPDEKIWAFIRDIFGKLVLARTNNKFLYYYFFWNFVVLLGYGPELLQCVICGQKLAPQILYFSYKNGGIMCQTCCVKDTSAKKINADVVKVLRLVLQKNWGVLSKLRIALSSKKLFKEISDDYCAHVSCNVANAIL